MDFRTVDSKTWYEFQDVCMLLSKLRFSSNNNEFLATGTLETVMKHCCDG